MSIQQLSIELKTFVSQFNPASFAELIRIQFHLIGNRDSNVLAGLSSPMRQLYYLVGLNLSSQMNNIQDLEIQFEQEGWEKMKDLLIRIEQEYYNELFEKDSSISHDEWLRNRSVSIPYFVNYYNQGPLNYEEQEIDRIQKYFTPFDGYIREKLGLRVDELLSFYNHIDSLPNKFLEKKHLLRQIEPTWEQFAKQMIEKGITPDKWFGHMPQHLIELADSTFDIFRINNFELSQVEEIHGTEKANIFLSLFTCKRELRDFLYFTEENILTQYPIINREYGDFMCFEMKGLLHAIFNKLNHLCSTSESISDKYFANRGKELEGKVKRIFYKLFKGECTIYDSFYTDSEAENDLLVISNRIAFIIEIKASKRNVAMRSPEKSFQKIKSNFEQVISKAYDQSFRIKEKFLDKTPFSIYSDPRLRNKIAYIKTSNFYKAYTIIVTLDKYGNLQSDLSNLLDLWDDDEFPWCVSVDDLETFVLALKKMNMGKKDFVHFLNLRSKMHGSFVFNDEQAVTGGFLKGKINYKIVKNPMLKIVDENYAQIFDDIYQNEGLGFENEKYLELKRSKTNKKLTT